MKLYASYTSPFARHCRIALLQGNLECEFIDTDYVQSAANSATQKVPFLEDGDLKLTDSCSILYHFATKSATTFIKDIAEQELFCMVNTCLDATINLFLLERDGITVQSSAYLQRQQDRIDTTLQALNESLAKQSTSLNTAEMRLACFIDWAIFRKRISIDGLNNLQALLDTARKDAHFIATAIPGSV
ncbi:MAG: glutathione S-transferase related protein [Osedax symbiont Rs1]|nr:MAG: glutathione S-transferase related protein [Osedax symbiont Rs1]